MPRFGLNTKGNLLGFEIKNSEKAGDYLVLHFKVDGRDFKKPVLKATKAFVDDKLTDDPTAVKKENREIMHYIEHVVLCFATEAQIHNAKQAIEPGFGNYLTAMEDLLPKNYASKSLDVFLQYEWKIRDGNTRTWLELPKNMKHGSWCIPSQPGEWKKVPFDDAEENEIALTFVDTSSGEPVEHPFVRTGWYMESPFANPQGEIRSNKPTVPVAAEDENFDDLPF